MLALRYVKQNFACRDQDSNPAFAATAQKQRYDHGYRKFLYMKNIDIFNIYNKLI